MNKLIPNYYYKNIYKIDYEKLKQEKIKCLLFDLDNTCLPYKEKKPTKKLINFLKELTQNDFKVIIFTNASKKRVEPFLSQNISCNYFSMKPLKKNFKKILNKNKYTKDEVCIIGDQLFTDIYGGNRIGIKTILVTPLSNEDLFLTKIFRTLEKIIIKHYTKKGIFKEGEYYD